MADVRIDVLWNLTDLRQPLESWALYVNHVVMFASLRLRNLFYDAGRPNVPLQGAVVLGEVQQLVQELGVFLPTVSSILDSEIAIQPVGQLAYLTHYPTGLWVDQEKDSSVIFWTRPLFIGESQYRDDIGEVAIHLLSPVSRRVIKQLDGLALETAYRRYGDDLARVSHVGPEALPAARKVRIFVSYRIPHREIAGVLHQTLEGYAHHTAFSPYLDRHDIRLGNWRQQLLEQIENCDIFLPIVTGDYARPGTVSSEELDFAQRVAQARGLEDFFAPIFLHDDLAPAARFLRSYTGLVIGNSGEISPENQELNRFLRTILTSALSRN